MAWRKSSYSESANCVEADSWRKSSHSVQGECVEAGDWRKSRHSEYNGNCVEAGDWRKSNYSMHNGDCVEVASGVAVRDTQDRDGTVLTFTATAWTNFLKELT